MSILDRRKFLQMIGLAGAAAAIPLGRVWSFPKVLVPKNLSSKDLMFRSAVDLAMQGGYQAMFMLHKDGLYMMKSEKWWKISESMDLVKEAQRQIEEERSRDQQFVQGPERSLNFLTSASFRGMAG